MVVCDDILFFSLRAQDNATKHTCSEDLFSETLGLGLGSVLCSWCDLLINAELGTGVRVRVRVRVKVRVRASEGLGLPPDLPAQNRPRVGLHLRNKPFRGARFSNFAKAPLYLGFSYQH